MCFELLAETMMCLYVCGISGQRIPSPDCGDGESTVV